MPNARVLSEKKQVVETLTQKLGSAAGVLVDYSGITVSEDTEMRAKMREAQVEYSVVKNTLMRFAIKNAGLIELDPLLSGTTSLAVHASDVVAPAKIIKEYAGKLDGRFIIKGGFYDGKVISVSEVEALAAIPPLPQLQAQLLGTMLAPISQLALVIKLIAEQNGAPAVEAAAPDSVPAEDAAPGVPPEESESAAEPAAAEPAAEDAAPGVPSAESESEPEPAAEPAESE